MKSHFRLKKSADFKRVRQLGSSYAHPLVVLITRDNNLPHSRVGIAAGKSIGNAVQRNRAKRILRAAVAPLISKITPAQDIVLLARQSILEQRSNTVQEVLLKKLSQAKLIDKNG